MRQRSVYSAFLGRAKEGALFGSSCLLAITIAAPPAAAHAVSSLLAQSEASDLAPGDYRWTPQDAPDGALNMVVDLTSQRAVVYRAGVPIGVSTISSGKPGHETPTGTFRVLEKEKVHHSNKYDDAPMPYMERLTWDGLALHAGRVRRFPASHGCIRLPAGFAAALFKENTRGMEVDITGDAPSRPETVLASRGNGRTSSQSSPDAAEADYNNGDPGGQPDQGAENSGDQGQDVPGQDISPPPPGS